jgi:hypothetical protein
MVLTVVAVAASMACAPTREEDSTVPANAVGSAATTSSGPAAAVTSSGSAAVTSSGSAAVTSSATTASDQVISVSVANGKVNPAPAPVDVKLGRNVVIEVTSDANDEVHVHGYDITVPVTAGQPARIPVAATIPGQFEVELHGSDQLLLILRVQ